MYHKDVTVVVSCHDDCGGPTERARMRVGKKKCQHAASRKDLLDGARLEIRLASTQDQSTL